jgi:Transmembrane secretion effector
VRFTLIAAAVLLLSSLALAFPLSIDFTSSLNFDPAVPGTAYHAMLHPSQPDDGPVIITFGFHIDAVNRARFIDLMREVRRMHLRNGAFSWRLDEDLSECHVFRVEMLVASWSGHLLQDERIVDVKTEAIRTRIAAQLISTPCQTSCFREWPDSV